ncbi:MAG: DUF1329 domain-containing protein [Gammaproteobacteria bacterium]|nr:DUF1329 domain-containing protein [Gammaproteobacteria bacterium]
MKSMNRVFPIFSTILLLLSFYLFPGSLAAEMILGKEYSVSPGTEPGTYVCKWGDETVNWKPQPWHNSSYAEIGPNIYDRWTQAGLPYPWEISVEERVKQDGPEIHDRSYTALYFNEFGDNYITEWSIDLISPNGTIRDKRLFEWMVAYRLNQEGIPKSLVDKVRAQYMFTFVAPNDFRGLGMSTTIYYGEDFNDEFLYLPAARRVRRLPQAARQDIIPGTIVRWEDFPQVKPFPDIDYEVVGYTLYGGQPEGTMGFTTETKGEKVNVGLDGVCEPAYILELTPHSKSYWYAKQRRIIGIKTGSSWYEETFDSNGELTRQRVNRRAIANTDPRLQNGNDPIEDWQMIWAGEYFYDPKSGFRMDWYMNTFWINYDEMPRDIVSLDNLSKEPVRKILFWE